MTDETESADDLVQWEYQALSRKTEEYLVDDLNIVGTEGWELVAIEHHKDPKSVGEAMCWTAFVKRPRTGEPTAVRSIADTAATDVQRKYQFEGRQLDDDAEEFKFQEEEDELKLEPAEAEVISEEDESAPQPADTEIPGDDESRLEPGDADSPQAEDDDVIILEDEKD